MPTYEYQCKACGHTLEEFQKMSEAPLTVCPKCDRPDLTRLVSATNFQLKGTGWYVTDIRDKGKPKPQESNETTSTETKTATSSESGSKDSSGSSSTSKEG